MLVGMMGKPAGGVGGYGVGLLVNLKEVLVNQLPDGLSRSSGCAQRVWKTADLDW